MDTPQQLRIELITKVLACLGYEAATDKVLELAEAHFAALDPNKKDTKLSPFIQTARFLGDLTGISPDFMLRCCTNWWRMYQAGNAWSYCECYLSAFRDILGLQLPEYEKYQAWETCAKEGGFRILHEEFCIVSDRPDILEIDDRNRPHSATGPSHRWRDGWSLYHWHGVRLSDEQAYIVNDPSQITVEKIEAETNSEVRRVMIERFGDERYIKECGATIVEELPADYPMKGLRTARLLKKDLPDGDPIVFLDVLNSTPEPDGSFKRYLIRVDGTCYNGDAAKYCHAASASTWRDTVGGPLTFEDWRDYSPAYES